ncbi:MAG: hypothetical protein K9K80_02055 [Spirochaetia bacterium]|nr:hypothetical protein [Spirochaetia bacterium]
MGYVGREAAVQMGKGGASWGTFGENISVKLPFTSEGIEKQLNYSEAEAIVGTSFMERMDVLSEHVEGSVDTYVNPDIIPFLLFYAFGVEYGVISKTEGYKHIFVPNKAGSSLPFFDMEVDRVIDKFREVSLKMGTLTLSCAKESRMTASFDVIGYDEIKDQATITNISHSLKQYFKFRRAAVQVDGDSASYDVDGMEFSIENNVQSDRYTTNAAGKLAEVEDQGRSASVTINSYLNPASYALRTGKHLEAQTVSLYMEFQVTDQIDPGSSEDIPAVHSFGIKIPMAYLSEAPNNIDGPDEQKMDLTFTVAEPTGVDFFTTSRLSTGSGQDTDTIAGTSDDGLPENSIVSAVYVDGSTRLFKYIGSTVASTESPIIFGTDVDAIYDSEGVIDDTLWEPYEAVYAWVRNANSDKVNA